MGLLGWDGLQKFWTKVKNYVHPYIKEAELDGNTLTFTKGNGETSSFTIEGGNGGESSITDLGEQENHKNAQQAMVDHLLEAEDGCYLFKYYCPCYQNACFAVVHVHRIEGEQNVYIDGTVYDNLRWTRSFRYDSATGFKYDGCWLPIASFNEELTVLETENKVIIGAINELNSKIGSGGAGLSMPRIRVANWHYTELPTFGFNEDGNEMFLSGRIVFSVNVQDGTVQEGDELQVCAMRKTYGKYKLRPILSKTLTTEDLENLAKQPYLQVSTDDLSNNNLGNSLECAMESFHKTDSSTQNNGKPKYVRIRRPVWKENSDGEFVVVNAFFSNVVPVNVRLRKYFDELTNE